jgi:hypothetical protein
MDTQHLEKEYMKNTDIKYLKPMPIMEFCACGTVSMMLLSLPDAFT